MIPIESAITLRILKERSWIVKHLVEIRARKVVEASNRRKSPFVIIDELADVTQDQIDYALKRKAIQTNKNPVITKHV